MTDAVVRTSVDGAVATITLDRAEALNAITAEMLVQLGDAVAAFDEHPTVRVIVLTGAGRAFSAGVDLKALGDRQLVDGAVGDVLDIPARAAIERITTSPRVVIAAVNGFCFTGALELALACDLVIVATEAKLGDTHAKFGLRPTWGMSQRLPRAVGITRARMLSYTASTFTGAQAAEWGLAVEHVPAEHLSDRVAEVAAQIAANSAGSLAAYKQLYANHLDLTSGLALEADSVFPIPDSNERVAAFR
ncbi:enoyl-CoA hydratase/isomerase family protein [Desertimonas flava]|uniref:enoyl-CoA hydratase/isomerase family protein n=1 Tax=Desertimonas flava TaxID=2064846 RepID=UPI000E34E10A|nr:enoyl-CoA hydratase/isomerase family protein [Desertimonas flava]